MNRKYVALSTFIDSRDIIEYVLYSTHVFKGDGKTYLECITESMIEHKDCPYYAKDVWDSNLHTEGINIRKSLSQHLSYDRSQGYKTTRDVKVINNFLMMKELLK